MLAACFKVSAASTARAPAHLIGTSRPRALKFSWTAFRMVSETSQQPRAVQASACEQKDGSAPLKKQKQMDAEPQPLKVKLLSDKACLPKRGSDGAAGYDLTSAEDCTIPARGKYMVNTDISVAIPPECYGRVAPRSGLAWKHSIDTGAGVIDSDYRGPLKVILFNFSDDDFQVKQGDRIAQLVLERIYTPPVVQTDDLDATVRGAGGLGSTGGFGNA